MNSLRALFLAAIAVAALTPLSLPQSRGSQPVSDAARLKLAESFGNLPLSFEANHGQTDSRVKFLSRGNGYSLFLTPTEAVLTLRGPAEAGSSGRQAAKAAKRAAATAKRGAVLRMKLLGSNAAPTAAGLEELHGKSNYFVGNDPKKWRTNVLNYGKVRFAGVYPGVDLFYYGNQRQLEYDFVVAPGADPSAITLGFAGAQRLQISPQGELVLQTRAGEVRWHKPVIYQQAGCDRQVVDGHFVRKGKRAVGFEVAAYDASKPLVIDPTLAYSTYLGGAGDDRGHGIAVDSTGNAYVTGRTASVDFPTASPFQAAKGASLDAFVTKLNPTGSALVYSTYLGGVGDDTSIGIAVDSSGNAYVTGQTSSTNFPTSSPVQAALGGDFDAFVTKLNPTGSALVYSTYLGGSGEDDGWAIAVDTAGSAYVTGRTASVDFPTASPFQANPGGDFDAFVTKFNATGSARVYSTYLGGNNIDEGNGIAADSGGNAYVTGGTRSTDFPTASPFQAASAGPDDAFVTKFNATGSALLYSTYLGGSSAADYGNGIAVDSNGNAYVTGQTGSADFPTASPFQAAKGVGDDAFVTKFNAGGSALLYSTYLGGNNFDRGWGIAVDSSGNAYVTGETGSTDFPTASPFQAAFGGVFDAFVTTLNPSGSALVYSTYLGGSAFEAFDRSGIAVDSVGNAYVTGQTRSTDFPTASPFQPAFGGGTEDAFVAKIAPTGVCSGAPGGIISWWPGEGNAQDIVSQHDGALQNGATFGTGIVGQAFSLDGIDDAIVVDNNAALNPASITVEAWVNPNSVPAGTIAAVVTKWGFDATVDSYFLGLLDSGGVVRVLGAIGDGATGDSGFSGGTVTLNTWNHIAMTYDAASDLNRLYLNGVSVGQRVRANGIFPTTSRVFIGREDSNNNRFFSGLIDEPTIYSRALTDAEILAIFNAGGNGKCGASPTGEADLSVTKTDAPDPALVSTNITYTVMVSNNGPNTATGIVLTDTLDAAVAYVSDTAGCNTAALPVLTCTLADLASGASTTVTIVVTAPAVAGTVTNNASVTANEADANLANNSASASTTVNTVQADVSITKTDSPDPQGVGGNITYTVTISNAGPDPATNVALTDTLSGAATTFVSVTSAGNTCNSAGFPTITCNMGTIASGTSETVTIVVMATAAGTVTNTAASTATEPDPNTANNTNIAQNTAVQTAGFTLAVTPSTITILPGRIATFTVTITPTPFVATVDLSATGAPPLGSISFGSTTLNVGNVATSTTMDVSSTGFFMAAAPHHAQAPLFAYWLPVSGFGTIGLLLVGLERKRFRANKRVWLAAALSLAIMASLIAGCAFGRDRSDEGTPFGTYPITVTATGGGVTQTTTVNVVVGNN